MPGCSLHPWAAVGGGLGVSRPISTPAPQSKLAPPPAPAPPPAAPPPLEKPIVLMKSREEGKPEGGAPPTMAVAGVTGAAGAKVEKEGQRPTQPVYQIQNRGMGAAAPSAALDREWGAELRAGLVGR